MPYESASPPGVLVRRSPLGWFGVVGDEQAISDVCIGYSTRRELECRIAAVVPQQQGDTSSLLREAADAIGRYFEGEPMDFRSIPVTASLETPFQQRVLQQLRRVRYGETVSYGELAERAGAPRAARAVGSIMARNRTPLLIPCHRVLASGGRLGGFSAPLGVQFKQMLLDLERGQLVPPGRIRETVNVHRRVVPCGA